MTKIISAIVWPEAFEHLLNEASRIEEESALAARVTLKKGQYAHAHYNLGRATAAAEIVKSVKETMLNKRGHIKSSKVLND